MLTTRTVKGKFDINEMPARVIFKLNAWAWSGAVTVQPADVNAIVKSDGTYSLDLFVNSTGNPLTHYEAVTSSGEVLKTFTLTPGPPVDLDELADLRQLPSAA